jgi:hypothetical protein
MSNIPLCPVCEREMVQEKDRYQTLGGLAKFKVGDRVCKCGASGKITEISKVSGKVYVVWDGSDRGSFENPSSLSLEPEYTVGGGCGGCSGCHTAVNYPTTEAEFLEALGNPKELKIIGIYVCDSYNTLVDSLSALPNLIDWDTWS